MPRTNLDPRSVFRSAPRHSSGWRRASLIVAALAASAGLVRVEASVVAAAGISQFRERVEPLLKEYCYDCHGDGMDKGGVTLDQFSSEQALLENRELWLKALKNLRAGVMPPSKKAQPTAEEKQTIEAWIKSAPFGVDPEHPDPGRVTVRRLNRVEYRNTIRDLMGVDFDTQAEFPPDDAGHGFDNIGEVLTLPPMLLEKYLAAAQTIVARAVPSVPRVPAEQVIAGRAFRKGDGDSPGGPASGSVSLSYYEPAAVSNRFNVTQAGTYQLALKLSAHDRFVDNQFDYNKCRLVFRVDGRELLRQEFTREGGRALNYQFETAWDPGEHELTFVIEPLTPDEKQVRSLSMRIDSVAVRGPMEKEHWVKPAGYERFFPRDPPESESGRREYARELLADFAAKAFRRPVDSATVERLAELAEAVYRAPNKTFEAGISQAMTAALASPRFLFREEAAEAPPAQGYPLIDEYSLANRLSYFLWSSMPDDELFALAKKNELRANLDAQVSRMMADPRFGEFIKHFTGQWLQARDIETVVIDAREVLGREAAPDPDLEKRRARFRELRNKAENSMTEDEKKELADLRARLGRRFGMPLRAELTGDLRRAMRQETEKTFEHVIRENRGLLELIDSDYTFLNERLARHYGLTNLNVTGDEMRRVTLPPDSPRGGILTQGTVLAVTSNPTRTSPVKRGLFILENVLGTPPPPPPPDITPLEDAAKGIKDRPVTLRETLALHREQPLCSSCHNRMDPLGLALENFNAMGMFRESERGEPIDATGVLLTGEAFATPRELKQILARQHASEFYHTLTEKMLTYALGRGLDYRDVETVDRIVARLEQSGGQPSALFAGIIESAPFQKTRLNPATSISPATSPAQPRADAKIKP